MRTFLFIIGISLLLSCENEISRQNQTNTGNGWIVDTTEMSGTEISDKFPLITNPSYVNVEEVALDNEAKVLVFKPGNRVLVYPLLYLDIEVLNDQKASRYFSVTYCPLTKSGIIWNRIIDEDTLTFSASGVLYRENLVPYDLETESMWSQMLMKGIHGEYAYAIPDYFQSFETSWSNIKAYFPEALVYKRETISSSYYSFERELKNNNGVRNVSDDEFYRENEKVYGIFTDIYRPFGLPVYTKSFENREQDIIVERLEGITVISSKKYDFIVSFRTVGLNLSPVAGQYPVIAEDERGVKYDVFGYPVNQNNETHRLQSPVSYTALWWAWKDFYDEFLKI